MFSCQLMCGCYPSHESENMKFVPASLLCSILLAASGCVGIRNSAIDCGANQPAIAEEVPALSVITYRWSRIKERETVLEVAFSASGGSMSVHDGWPERRIWKPTYVWDASVSRCSKEECIQIIDRSLAKFRNENPDVRLQGFHIEMHVVRDLWGEILASLRQRLATLPGVMGKTIHDPVHGDSLADTPDEISDEIRRVLETSSTIAAIQVVLRKHGMNVRKETTCGPFQFSNVHGGEKWSDIANLPGLGIERPGLIEIDVSGMNE